MKTLISIFALLVVAASTYLAYDISDKQITSPGEVPSRLSENQEEAVLTEPTGKKLFSFMLFGDNESNTDVLKKIVSRTNQEDVEFVMNTGDTSFDRSPESFQDYAEIMENLRVPVYAAAGNSDIGEDGTLNLFYEYVAEKNYYSFNYNGYHFVVLYNVGESAFSEEQLTWLETNLVQNKNKPVLLFMHKPLNVPLSQLVEYDDFIDPERKQAFLSLIAKHPEISHIYTGHAHALLRYTLQGVPVTISGGGGGEPNVPVLYDPNLPYHMIRVDVYEDGLKEEVIPL